MMHMTTLSKLFLAALLFLALAPLAAQTTREPLHKFCDPGLID